MKPSPVHLSLVLAASLGLAAPAAMAQTKVPAVNPQTPVPAGYHTAPPPPVNLLSGKDAHLTPRQVKAVTFSKQWLHGKGAIGRGDAGTVVYRYGGPMPTLVCAPLQVCSITLQPGEVVNTINVGDSVRWLISPAVSGPQGSQTTHVVVKVTDSDLHSSLMISTNRRTYAIRLVSTKDRWMPRMSFSYPEDAMRRWQALRTAQVKHRNATVLPDTGLNLADLDFQYEISGDDPSWTPQRVYSGGGKTYIEFPRSMLHRDAPALVAIGSDGNTQMVNYRVHGHVYIVDKLLQKAALITGVGDNQTRVTISYEGGE